MNKKTTKNALKIHITKHNEKLAQVWQFPKLSLPPEKPIAKSSGPHCYAVDYSIKKCTFEH